MKEFVALRAKTYICLMDDGSDKKKAKGAKECVIKCEHKFENISLKTIKIAYSMTRLY